MCFNVIISIFFDGGENKLGFLNMEYLKISIFFDGEENKLGFLNMEYLKISIFLYIKKIDLFNVKRLYLQFLVMAQITPSIVDPDPQVKNASIERSFLVQSLLLKNILEENAHLKKLYSQAKIIPSSNIIQDIIHRKKENEFLSYNYFISSDIFRQNAVLFDNYTYPIHYIMENTSDDIIIHIIEHLDNKEHKGSAPKSGSIYSIYSIWSLGNFACAYSRLSILKYLVQNKIGAYNLDEDFLTTASKHSNEEIITYLLDNKYVDPRTFNNKPILCEYLDNNPNLDSTNKTTLKNRINNWN